MTMMMNVSNPFPESPTDHHPLIKDLRRDASSKGKKDHRIDAMTRKSVGLNNPERQIDSACQHSAPPALDCDSQNTPNSEMLQDCGNPIPPTFPGGLVPSPSNGLLLRAIHSSRITTTSAENPISRGPPMPKANDLQGNAPPTCQSFADYHATAAPDSAASIERNNVGIDHKKRKADNLLLKYDDWKRYEAQHAARIQTQEEWLCTFPGCTKAFWRADHLKRYKASIHEGTSQCYFHGPVTAKQCLRCPGWVQVLRPGYSLPRRNAKVRHETIPAAHGFALTLKPGAHLRIVDLHGQQVVDFMAWALPFRPDNSCEHFSASYTRYRLGGSAPPQVGECLYSNRDRPMFEILEDKVKCHDMLFMACNPSFYARLDKPGHRSCASNIAEAMARKGFELVEDKGKDGWSGVHDPFNVFQNTPYYTLKALECSRKGDWIEMKVSEEMEHGVVVALSSCPYEDKGFNGGKVTDVGVVWEEL